MEKMQEESQGKEIGIEDLEERYPTIESAVDDYRNGILSDTMFAVRFPDQVEQAEVQRHAAERNASDKLEE